MHTIVWMAFCGEGYHQYHVCQGRQCSSAGSNGLDQNTFQKILSMATLHVCNKAVYAN
jgi:hypothetical protein